MSEENESVLEMIEGKGRNEGIRPGYEAWVVMRSQNRTVVFLKTSHWRSLSDLL